MTHEQKLHRIDALMNDPIHQELDALVMEVEAFEKQAYPIAPPSLAEAMKFRRDQMGENQREISWRAGMSLNRWRNLEQGKVLTLDDARKLHTVGIPADVLLG